MDLNTNAVTVQDGATCGQLVPERDTQPVFDASRRALRLPIVLRNATTGYVTAPARVSFTADSIYRYRDGQQVPGSGSTRTLNADSASVNGRVASWNYDTLLVASGETQRIAPGARSRRLWLEFTGPELWLKPGGADADTTLSIRLDASGELANLTIVPAVAPDTTPSGWLDDTNLTSDPRSLYKFVRNVVLVLFRPGTTQMARTDAIASVSGEVVGGRRLDGVDGFYFVRLPPDSSNDRVFDAIRDLERHPAVAAATLDVVHFDATSYAKPGDDFAGWGRAVWRLSKDSAYTGALRSSSALEAVNAPRAWGCSVGDPTVRVAIVDQGMRTINLPDLGANNQYIENGNFLADTAEHGVRVSHILAARGDNGVAMSGMMWRAATYLFDVSPRSSTGVPQQSAGQTASRSLDILSAIVHAADSGARVINLSMAARIALPLSPITPAQDTVTRKGIHSVVEALRFFAQGRTPLVVISTGITPGATAHYAQWPVLADSLPGQVINVAASNRTRQIMFVPPNSPLVDIAAPGDSVGTWKTAGGTRESGTSFSTPLVAGVAGLLVAFDSTLTTSEVRDLVIQGAQAGGHTAGGFPILDAYESLHLAAQRRGAPLCGNRLWGDSGIVVAERVPANASAFDDTLAVVPASIAPTYLLPIHGGKRLANSGFGAAWREINWTPNGWLVVPPGPVVDTTIGGTWWSARGTDHDRTRTLVASVGPSSPGTPPTIRYNFTVNPSPSLTVSSAPVRSGVDSNSSACVRFLGSGSCGDRMYWSYQSKVSVAMSPDGTRGFYAITEIVNRVDVTGPANPCPDDFFATCHEFEVIAEPTGPTQVFEINFASNTAVQRWPVQGYVFRLGMSERNDEIVTTEGEQRFVQHYGWMSVGFDVPFVASSTFSPNTCKVVFRDVRQTTTTWGDIRRQVAVRPSTGCTLNTSRDGIGGIAPRIRRP